MGLGATPLVALSAQTPSTASLDGAVFVERVHTDVSSRAGLGERHRVVDRFARFEFAVRGDTVLVTADSLDLTETADGARRSIDVDAVIGGRWKVVRHEVIDRPVVTTDIADVSDVAAALDDFFPADPPPLQPSAQVTDSQGRAWRRLADSAGYQRYRWSQQGTTDAGTNPDAGIASTVETHEDVALAWSPLSGPRTWTRTIKSTVTSTAGTRTIRSTIEQHIVVVRLH